MNTRDQNKQDNSLIKLNVAIEYKGNSLLLLIKIKDPNDDDEFLQALYPEITKRLSKEFPNEQVFPENVAYRVCSNAHNIKRHKISTDNNIYYDIERQEAEIHYLLYKKLNYFIEYKGQRYFLRFPLAPESARETIIHEFLIEKYPNDNFDHAEIDYKSCLPIARFDDHVIMNNKGDGFDFELTQFKNLIEIMIYCSQVEKGKLHHGLIETIKSADDEVRIIDEFKDSAFHLIAFTTKYIGHTAYAFIEHHLAKSDEAIFGCMTKKDVKKVAEQYMDESTYRHWFGARLRVV